MLSPSVLRLAARAPGAAGRWWQKRRAPPPRAHVCRALQVPQKPATRQARFPALAQGRDRDASAHIDKKKNAPGPPAVTRRTMRVVACPVTRYARKRERESAGNSRAGSGARKAHPVGQRQRQKATASSRRCAGRGRQRPAAWCCVAGAQHAGGSAQDGEQRTAAPHSTAPPITALARTRPDIA